MFEYKESTGIRDTEDPYAIHEFYMAVINSTSNIIYWVDTDCHLRGCNQAFVKLLGLDKVKDFKGTPYEQMKHFAHWKDKRIEQFKLDDMSVIFSGQSQSIRNELPVEDKKGNILYFQSTRIPYYDHTKKLIGLIVTLTDVTLNKTQEEPVQPPIIDTHHASEVNDNHIPKILVIEDNIVVQCVEKALLMSLHCQVDIAQSGDDALRIFVPGKYDLVLMDIGLVDTSGYAVAKELRKLENNTQHHVPIIALTGYDADVVKDDCEHYFMEGAITKPLSSDQATQIINRYIYHLDTNIQGLKHS